MRWHYFGFLTTSLTDFLPWTPPNVAFSKVLSYPLQHYYFYINNSQTYIFSPDLFLKVQICIAWYLISAPHHIVIISKNELISSLQFPLAILFLIMLLPFLESGHHGDILILSLSSFHSFHQLPCYINSHSSVSLVYFTLSLLNSFIQFNKYLLRTAMCQVLFKTLRV